MSCPTGMGAQVFQVFFGVLVAEEARDRDDGDARPAEGGTPRLEAFFAVAVQQGVDDQRFQPGIPGSSGFCGLGRRCGPVLNATSRL